MSAAEGESVNARVDGFNLADTIEDSSALKGYIMAGSYIRPFTVDLAYTYRF